MATTAYPRAALSPSPSFNKAPTRSDLSLRIAEGSRNVDLSRPKSSHHTGTGLGALSPVTAEGTYEFDRVLKSGQILKRKKRTNVCIRWGVEPDSKLTLGFKTWKTVYLVLRPRVLSLYADKDETRLRHQINLEDITAVAVRTDRRRKKEHEGCFGLYTPARNYHFEAESLLEAERWVSMIHNESRLQEQEMNIMSSPEDNMHTTSILGRLRRPLGHMHLPGKPRDGSSSPDSIEHTRFRGNSAPRMPSIRSTSPVQELSAMENASYSDFSDAPIGGASEPMPVPRPRQETDGAAGAASAASSAGMSSSQRRMMYMAAKSSSQNRHERAEIPEAFDEDDRVVQQGYVSCLRLRSGVRQWKRCWAVLRPRNLALYKTDKVRLYAVQVCDLMLTVF